MYQSDNVDFIYHSSGLNNSKIQERSYGKIFPLNYLYSEIIPLRVVDGKENIVCLYINTDFEIENFIRILNFIKSFDRLDTIDKTIISFKNYDEISSNSIKECLSNFENYKYNKNLFVNVFPSNFKNQ